MHCSQHQTRRPRDGDITHYSRILADAGCLFKNRYWKTFLEITTGMGAVMGHIIVVLAWLISVADVLSVRRYKRFI